MLVGPDSARNRGGTAVAVHRKIIENLAAAQRQIPTVLKTTDRVAHNIVVHQRTADSSGGLSSSTRWCTSREDATAGFHARPHASESVENPELNASAIH